jgi:hypothetical protein
MKTIIITIAIFISSISFNPLFSQKDTAQFYNKTLSKNNFSVELGGKGWYYSIGYERTFYNSKKLLMAGSVNLSYDPFIFEAIILPIGINALVGEKRNKLLLGLSVTNTFNFFNYYPKSLKERTARRASGGSYNPLYTLLYATPYIGYRRYFKKGNSISIAFTPVIPLVIDDAGGSFVEPKATLPWLGITYNLRFSK